MRTTQAEVYTAWHLRLGEPWNEETMMCITNLTWGQVCLDAGDEEWAQWAGARLCLNQKTQLIT